MKKEESFITNRIKSIKYAVRGALHLIRTEASIIAQFIVFVAFVILGLIVGINRFEWMMQVICFGMVISIEGLNTAIEKICDFVHPDFNEHIGTVKDISAGAVTFAAVTSMIVAAFIYYPYIF